MFCRNKFEGTLKFKRVSVEDLAGHMNINRATLYKKIAQKSDFTRAEVQIIKNYLGLSTEEVMDIFYGEEVA